jgi:hypothetical protein
MNFHNNLSKENKVTVLKFLSTLVNEKSLNE